MPWARMISSGRFVAAVGHDREGTPHQGLMAAPAVARRRVLGAHVLGFLRGEPAQRAQVGEDSIRTVRVHVHLEQGAGADHDYGIAMAAQFLAHDHGRRQPLAAHQRLGAVAVLLLILGILDLGDGRRDLRVIRLVSGGDDRVPVDEQEHALQHVHETAAAGVHHPRRLEHREQRGRALERLARGVHQPVDAEDEVRGGALLRSVRGVPDDGQNGALDRVVERFVEVVDAPAQRLGEPARVHALASLQVGREAQQEVRQHHPAVAARTQQRRFGCIVRDRRKPPGRGCAAGGPRWPPR